MLFITWNQDVQEPLSLKGTEIIKDLKRRAVHFAEPFKSIYQSVPDDTPTWHSRLSSWSPIPWDNRGGRVTLAGDSAHAMTFRKCFAVHPKRACAVRSLILIAMSGTDRGQGLNNAISDAASLLAHIQDMTEQTPTALAAAVSAYEKELWVRGKEAVQISNENSLMLHNWEMIGNSPLFKIGGKQRLET